MPITIQRDSLFKQGYSIKYITGWDNNFTREKYTGKLRFYDGDPLYIIDVAIDTDRNKLTEEDIVITIGEHHNASNIDDMITKMTPTIYEICKSSVSMGFVLDLKKMRVIERRDFSLAAPIHGLNTLFMFENIPYTYYCLANPSKNINNNEFYAWFISYIYSTMVCLTPANKIDDFAKKFLQAISLLAFTNGKKGLARISSRATVLNCGLNDVGEKLLPVPGENTKRFEALFMKSMEQMVAHKNQKGKL